MLNILFLSVTPSGLKSPIFSDEKSIPGRPDILHPFSPDLRSGETPRNGIHGGSWLRIPWDPGTVCPNSKGHIMSCHLITMVIKTYQNCCCSYLS